MSFISSSLSQRVLKFHNVSNLDMSVPLTNCWKENNWSKNVFFLQNLETNGFYLRHSDRQVGFPHHILSSISIIRNQMQIHYVYSNGQVRIPQRELPKLPLRWMCLWQYCWTASSGWWFCLSMHEKVKRELENLLIILIVLFQNMKSCHKVGNGKAGKSTSFTTSVETTVVWLESWRSLETQSWKSTNFD